MNPKLIACRVVIDEIKPYLPADFATEIFEISLHTRPDHLRETLQKAINESDGAYDPIYLGYGLCGMAAAGLVAQRSRLVIPRVDDCIAMFLGSQAERRRQLQIEPGTYFLTTGYIGDDVGSPWSDYDRMAKKYGAARAEALVKRMIKHYKRMAYIRMPHATSLEADREYSKKTAARFDLCYEEIAGTPRLLEQMARQELDGDFVVLEPGQAISAAHFLQPESEGK
jgi:hypothetical protein